MPDQSLQAEIERLRAELSHREMEIALFHEVAELVSSGLDLQTVYTRVAERTRQLIDAETLLVPIISHDRTTYTYKAAAGEHAGEIVGQTLPIDTGACGWVVRHQRAYWKDNEAAPGPLDPTHWEQHASALILVPLLGKQRRLVGGLTGLNKRGRSGFTRRDFDLLQLFAKQVGFAIENAMVLQELNEASQRAETYRAELEVSNERLTLTNENLRNLAVHDPLTGLPNRTLILDRLQHGLANARRNQELLALLMIDLNQFKEVNDTLGHLIGDQLLAAVGQRFLHALREGDTLGRLGGDEFAVVVPAASREAAAHVAANLSKALKSPVTIDNHEFSIGASIGIALFPDDGPDPGTLLRSADLAMYTAKRNREPYTFFQENLARVDPDRIVLLRELRAAIANDNFEIALQPKLDLHLDTITGVEVVARWNHPELDTPSPEDFIPLLEGTGMIKSFAVQILEKALREYTAIQSAGFDLDISVNLSIYNLKDFELPDRLAALLDRYSVPPSAVTLEIAENSAMRADEEHLLVLHRLHDIGILLSIDDFGTGYSSLGHLKRLPVTQLKIDRSLINLMTQRNDDAVVVRSTIGLAHNLGLTTVAEGVETLETLRALKLAGCDAAQGFFVSHPLPPRQLFRFLESQAWPVRTVEAVPEPNP